VNLKKTILHTPSSSDYVDVCGDFAIAS